MSEKIKDPASFYKKINSQYNKAPALETSPDEIKSKRRVFISLLVSMGILQTLYMNLATFFPTFAEENYPWVKEIQVSVVLAMFQVAYLMVAPLIGQNLQKIGRKNSILIGYTLTMFATVGFGLIAYIPKSTTYHFDPVKGKDVLDEGTYDKLFFAVAIIIRFLQGVGDSMVSTAAYSIISIEFPAEREKYVGLCQTAVGLGLLSGPFIGQTIFIGAGYSGTFYAMAGILFVALILVTVLIPNRINAYQTEFPHEVAIEPRESRPSVQAMPIHKIAERSSFNVIGLAKKSQRYSRRSAVLEAQISYRIFFTNMRAMTAIISSMFAMIFMLFYEPVLANYLINHYGVSKDVVGYYFSIGCFTYALASPFVGLLCAKIPRRYVTLSAFLMVAISMFLLGPSELMHFPDKLGMTLTGIGCLGFSVSFVFVPLLPEIVSAVSDKEGIEQTPFLCDKASGIFNSAYGIGNCVAPLVGAALTQSVGFQFTCDIMGFSSLAFFFIYFFFAVLPALMQKPKLHDPLTETLPDNSMTMDGNLTVDFKQNNGKPGALNDSNTYDNTYGQN